MIAWITANWVLITTILGIVMAVASAVTALTKTPKDDKVVDFLRSLFGRLGVLKHSDAPGTVKLPGASASGPLLAERADNDEPPAPITRAR